MKKRLDLLSTLFFRTFVPCSLLLLHAFLYSEGIVDKGKNEAKIEGKRGEGNPQAQKCKNLNDDVVEGK